MMPKRILGEVGRKVLVSHCASFEIDSQSDALSTVLHFHDGNSEVHLRKLCLKENRSGLQCIIALQALGNHFFGPYPPPA